MTAVGPQLQDVRLAIIAIVVSVFALSLGDAVIKASSTAVPIWQMYILRSALALPVLIGLKLQRNTPFSTDAWRWVTLRSALLVFMWLSYYSALSYMPLSLAAAAYYTAPLFIILMVALLSGKLPVLQIWVGVLLGFGGVLLILRPESSDFRWVTLLPVFAAFLYAVAAIMTSSKLAKSDPVSLAIALNVAFIIGGVVIGFWSGASDHFLFGPWVAVDANLLGIMVVLAAAITIGSVGAAIAYQKGPPAIVAAFDYSYLVFSLAWGALFFQEFPQWVSVVGIVAIAMSGILVLRKASA